MIECAFIALNGCQTRVHRLSVALQVDKKDHPLFPYSKSSAALLQTKSKRKNHSKRNLEDIPAEEMGPPAVSDASPPQDKVRATSPTEEILRSSFEFLVSDHSKHLEIFG
jgi:hypothetical protein